MQSNAACHSTRLMESAWVRLWLYSRTESTGRSHAWPGCTTHQESKRVTAKHGAPRGGRGRIEILSNSSSMVGARLMMDRKSGTISSGMVTSRCTICAARRMRDFLMAGCSFRNLGSCGADSISDHSQRRDGKRPPILAFVSSSLRSSAARRCRGSSSARRTGS